MVASPISMGTSWYRRARYLVHVAANDLCDTNSMALESHAFAAARDLRLPVVGTGGSSLGTAMAMGCLLVGSSGGSVATTNKVGGRVDGEEVIHQGTAGWKSGTKRFYRTTPFWRGKVARAPTNHSLCRLSMSTRLRRLLLCSVVHTNACSYRARRELFAQKQARTVGCSLYTRFWDLACDRGPRC